MSGLGVATFEQQQIGEPSFVVVAHERPLGRDDALEDVRTLPKLSTV